MKVEGMTDWTWSGVFWIFWTFYCFLLGFTFFFFILFISKLVTDFTHSIFRTECKILLNNLQLWEFFGFSLLSLVSQSQEDQAFKL